jgi:hypothetical protein
MDIEFPQSDVKLASLAIRIREECEAVEMAGRTGLGHAIAAGKYLKQAHDQVGRGFRNWLTRNCLKKSACYNYMKLAECEQSVQNSGHSSIDAALKALRTKSGDASSKPKNNTGSSLNRSDWIRATLEERRQFLDSIGVEELCKAFSFALRAELRRRVAGQNRIATSPLGDTVAKGIRQALSLQKSSKPKDEPAMGVAAALNAINKKLEAEGLDLNNIAIVIDATVTQRQSRKAA